MLRRLIEWFKAWRRGEKRCCPPGVRGRVFIKSGTIKPTRVWREKEQKWYSIKE